MDTAGTWRRRWRARPGRWSWWEGSWPRWVRARWVSSSERRLEGRQVMGRLGWSGGQGGEPRLQQKTSRCRLGGGRSWVGKS